MTEAPALFVLLVCDFHNFQKENRISPEPVCGLVCPALPWQNTSVT